MAYKLLGTDQASALFLKQNSSIPLINQALLKYQMNKIHQGHLLTNKQNRAGEEKEVFDTQKGIVRKIKVKDNGFEKIELDNKKIECKKFTLNASSNPKDKGPFPEYTLWYDKNDELMKFKFKNWKDDKTITIIRTQ